MYKTIFFAVLAAALIVCNSNRLFAQRSLGARPSGSGGVLMPEQAAYDVKSYDLDLRVNPETQTIKGALVATAAIVQPLKYFVLDLDAPLTVETVSLINNNSREPLAFERRENRIWIEFPLTKQPGETVAVLVEYNGKPRVAPAPPWVGGFVWSRTADGQPWFSVACQNDGADIWFPVKDHPSDEADTVSLHFTVPQPLIVASNGKLQSAVKNADGTTTFNWSVSQPINNYDITINAAPYRTIEDQYKSVAGETIPIIFYVLPADFEKGKDIVRQTKEFLAFFEERLGAYPFRADKLGIAHTPYLGMEHQTIISYGSNFTNNESGFDGLMFHELGHEWWGNLVTASDWRDFWIHEGFQSYMDALYAEKLAGKARYDQIMAATMRNLRNVKAVAPRESRTTVEMYMLPPDYVQSDNDIYGKGSAILHTLRGLVGDEPFFAALRRMAYPNREIERLTNGRQTRFAATDDFLRIAENAAGQKLDWFFEVYLRQPKLPRLVAETNGNQLNLRWETPDNLPFPMPVEVRIGNAIKRYEMPDGKTTIALEPGQQFVVDPNNKILKAQSQTPKS